MIDLALKLLPPQEAIDYFRQKGYRIGFSYLDVWQQEHQAAFTVAKAMQLDLLQDIRAAVDAALVEGTTLQTFQQRLRPNLVQRGWWGKQEVTDPVTGEKVLAQLGSPRRLKVIYDTNLRTAHAEGQWQRIQAARATLPYLMYDHIPSPWERPEHAAWDGLVLRVDDPWWLRHMPVKAWGCKCRVIQLGDRQLKQLGVEAGQAPEESWTEYTNQRSGETQRVPAGVDPAFNYPPGGRQQALQKALAEKQAKAAEGLAPPIAAAVPPIDPRTATVEEFIAAGKRIVDSLPDAATNPMEFHSALVQRMSEEVGISTPCKVVNTGLAANLVREASQLFPDSWTRAADEFGNLYTKGITGRAWHQTYDFHDPGYKIRTKVQNFGYREVTHGDGFITVGRGDLPTAVHEFSHRLQSVLPNLDQKFSTLHRQRTTGDPQETLASLYPGHGYGLSEVTRKDKYFHAYQGKEYDWNDKPKEVMTMAMEAILGAGGKTPAAAERLRMLYTVDREMVDLTIGLLFHWIP